MLIIGFDPGLNKTGFGVIARVDKKPKYIASGIIDNLKADKFPLHKRLAYLQKQTNTLVGKYKPQCAAVEEVFGGPYAKSSLILAMAHSAILGELGTHDLDVECFSPTQVKKMITGTGKASKELVNQMTQRHLGLSGTLSSDAADALAIALCRHYMLCH